MRPPTHQDKVAAFKSATCSFAKAKKRWEERAQTVLTDEDLMEALKYELGIAGGSSGYRDCPCIHYQGAGLKIWACWEGFMPQQTEPIFKGNATIRMARDVYSIKHPDDAQLDLF